MIMTCSYCRKVFKRKKRRPGSGNRGHHRVYCGTDCFKKKIGSDHICAHCGLSFKAKQTRSTAHPDRRYCTRTCYNLRLKPLPPVEIYGDAKDIEFIMAYRKHKYETLKKN